jgi:hypothetical protein
VLVLVTFKGYTVKSGVKWIVDKDSITITCYPSKTTDSSGKKVSYSLKKKTWKNKCSFKSCGAVGQLDGHGTGKGKYGVEGQVYCKRCKADWCGVTGRELSTKSKNTLIPASKKSNTSTAASVNTNEKKKALTEIKKEYNEKSQPKKDYKLTIPSLVGIREGSYIELKPPLVEKSQTFFIGSVDASESDMQLVLYDKVPEPGSTYTPPSDSNTTSITVDGASSSIEKTIMLKGAELKTISKIYNWLRKDGGSGGFKYSFYYNWHAGTGDPYKINHTYLKKRWKMKVGNCVFFAWAFYLMCKGAGIKVNICHGKAIFVDGTYGHFWNKYGGKIYDCSSVSCKKYIYDRKVK